MRQRVLFLILLFLTSSLGVSAQKYRNKQLGLISYGYIVNPTVKSKFDEYAYLFPDSKNSKTDKVISTLKVHTWLLLKELLEEGTEMYILPIDAHSNVFKNDPYGFPNVTINTAIRRGNSRFYLRVVVNINAPVNKTERGYGSLVKKDTSLSDKELEEGAFYPEISVEVTTYNRNGILPVQKVTGSASPSTPWVISEDTFKGLIKGQEADLNDEETFLGLLNRAIKKLVANF